MRILIAVFALMLAMATTAHADAVTEQDVESIQKVIKGMGCTVADSDIEAENGGYEADDVICDRVQYDIYFDGDFNVTNKVREN